MTRKEAKAAGEKFYDGPPCAKAGHTKRYTNDAACVACLKARDQTPKHKAAQKARRGSPEGKARQKAANQSPKNIAAQEAYRNSQEGKLKIKATKKAYRNTPEGKAVEKASSKLYRETLWGKANNLWRTAKKSAKAKHLPFDITVEDVIRLIVRAQLKWEAINQYLPEMWKIKFDNSAKGNGKRNPFTPSLDQIIPGKGYTLGNVQIVHWFWNAFLGDWFSDHQAIAICNAISAAHLAACENPELAEILRAV